MYYVEVYGKTGLLAGVRMVVGIDAAKALKGRLESSHEFGDIFIFEAVSYGSLYDKGGRVL